MRFLLYMIAVLMTATSLASAAMKIERLGPALTHPWGMDFLSASQILVTTRAGKLFAIHLETGQSQEITGLPEVAYFGQGGLLDVAVDGEDIFLCYAKPLGNQTTTAIDKARLTGQQLSGRMTIFSANEPSQSVHHFGCRLAIHKDHLYASLGDRGARQTAQMPNTHKGAIIRILKDGSTPADNPRLAGWTDETYTIGHRNPQGLAIHPQTGQIWAHEHGPQGGDEINILIAGGNYGWPIVSHGKEYGTDTPVSDITTHPDMEDPTWVWVPSIAPSGMAFYPSDAPMFPELGGHLLVGSLKFKRLYQVMIDQDGSPVSERIILDRSLGRIRDIAVGPDGALLILNDATKSSTPTGGLYRLSR